MKINSAMSYEKERRKTEKAEQEKQLVLQVIIQSFVKERKKLDYSSNPFTNSYKESPVADKAQSQASVQMSQDTNNSRPEYQRPIIQGLQEKLPPATSDNLQVPKLPQTTENHTKMTSNQLPQSITNPFDARGQRTEVFNRRKRGSCKLTSSTDKTSIDYKKLLD